MRLESWELRCRGLSFEKAKISLHDRCPVPPPECDLCPFWNLILLISALPSVLYLLFYCFQAYRTAVLYLDFAVFRCCFHSPSLALPAPFPPSLSPARSGFERFWEVLSRFWEVLRCFWGVFSFRPRFQGFWGDLHRFWGGLHRFWGRLSILSTKLPTRAHRTFKVLSLNLEVRDLEVRG